MGMECHLIVKSLSDLVNRRQQRHCDVSKREQGGQKYVSSTLNHALNRHSVCTWSQLAGLRTVDAVLSPARLRSSESNTTTEPRIFLVGGQVVNSARFHSRIVVLADALSVLGRDLKTSP
jgi:hypothetical protein